MQPIITKGYINSEEDMADEKIQLYDTKNLDVHKTYQIILLDDDATNIERIEVINTIFIDLMQFADLNLKEYKGIVTAWNMHVNNAHLLRSIGRFLGCLFGSSTWRNQKPEEFDKVELLKRLEQIKTQLK